MFQSVHGVSMGLKDLVSQRRSRVLPQEVGDAAVEVIPEFFTKGRVAPKYREHLLENYRTQDGYPPRRDENGQLRSMEETQLDRAWNDVAETMDKSEGNIRRCVLNVYDTPGEHENKPARLRSDFDEILELADSNSKE